MIPVRPNDFSFTTDQEVFDYFIEIIEIMMTRLGITSTEAVGRINQRFGKFDEITEEVDHHILSEFPSFWAYDIYFGHGSFWWIEKEQRASKNLPPLIPLSYDGPK